MDYKDSPIYILYIKSYIILQYIKIYVYIILQYIKSIYMVFKKATYC